MKVNAEKLGELLRSYKFNFGDERELQDAIAGVLEAEEVDFAREVNLSNSDRIDFMIDSLGIEVKIGFSFADVVRQLHRYAGFKAIDELILITSKLSHQMPEAINGKKLTTIHLALTNSL